MEAGQRLLAYIASCQPGGRLNKSAIEKVSQVRRQTLVDWANGVAVPELDTLARIASNVPGSSVEGMLSAYRHPVGIHKGDLVVMPDDPSEADWAEVGRRLYRALERAQALVRPEPPEQPPRKRRTPR